MDKQKKREKKLANNDELLEIHALADDELSTKEKLATFKKCLEDESFRDEYVSVLNLKKMLESDNSNMPVFRDNSSEETLQSLKKNLDSIDREKSIAESITFFKSMGSHYFIIICFTVLSSVYLTKLYQYEFDKTSSIASVKSGARPAISSDTMKKGYSLNFNHSDENIVDIQKVVVPEGCITIYQVNSPSGEYNLNLLEFSDYRTNKNNVFKKYITDKNQFTIARDETTCVFLSSNVLSVSELSNMAENINFTLLPAK